MFVLALEEDKGNVSIVSLLKYQDELYKSYTPLFKDEKTASKWIKDNKSELKEGNYFLLKVDGKNKLHIKGGS